MPSPLRLGAAGRPCAACGAPLAVDQRYCLACGELAAARRLDPLARARGGPGAAHGGATGASLPSAAGRAPAFALPSPQLAAAAVLVTLGFGVIAGGLADDVGAAGERALVVVRGPAPAPPPVAAATPPAGDSGGGGDRGAGSSDVAAAPSAPAPAPVPVAPPATPPPASSTPDGSSGDDDVPAIPDAPQTAPVKYVWIVSLTGHGASAFADGTPAAYLRSLVPKGVLLQNYTAVAHGSLANGLGLLTGQGPTAQTLADCAVYEPFQPSGKAGADGQRPGTGCVLPADVPNLPAALADGGRTWKAYVEDIGAGGPGQPATCRHPDAGAQDPFAAPRPGDAYLTARDPFVYLAGLTASPDCAANVVGTDALAADLANPDITPNVSFVIPSACHDGRDAPCADGAPAGLAAADAWLQGVLDPILASKAYADGGMVVVTFDSAPADGPEADSTGAPWLPARWPNVPDGAAPGGGTVGALVLSPFAPPGATVTEPYDHFSLLRTVGDLFGLEPLGYAGADGVKPFGADVLRPPAS